jgi:hypothetical protein
LAGSPFFPSTSFSKSGTLEKRCRAAFIS